MRSFGIVDEKVAEADFFLEKLRESNERFFEARCYFNAFVVSARSITFCLQASMKGVENFSEWYEDQIRDLANFKYSSFFNRIRTESQKIGRSLLSCGKTYRNKKGELRYVYYFSGDGLLGSYEIPTIDVVSACEQYLAILINLVYRCYRSFGHVMDPMQYYSLEGIAKNKKTIEELEVELGFNPGWSNLPGFDISDRLRALRYNLEDPTINIMFKKYLKKEVRYD